MLSYFDKIQKEVRSSVRLVAVEERFDLIFSRPFGLIFAKIAAKMNATPTQISILSMITGVIGGIFFLWQDHFIYAISGAFLVVLAGVLDSSDGQLARLTGQSSELGRIIDGIVDNIVFISVYLCSAIYLFDIYGVWQSVVLALFAGIAHSWKSAVYEFHKSEYFYLIGQFKSSRVHFAHEVKETFKKDTFFQKFVYYTYLDYCNKQEKNAFRTPILRKKFEELAYNPITRDSFVTIYENLNKSTLFWWAWIGGTNVQRSAILIAILAGHIEFYFLGNILSIIPHYFAGRYQQNADQKIISHFE
jgi:phosphatidylglycerophosphate synthase